MRALQNHICQYQNVPKSTQLIEKAQKDITTLVILYVSAANLHCPLHTLH